MFCSRSAMSISRRASIPTVYRPVDVPEIRGDASKLQRDTGWQPTIKFRQTLSDVLADCRQRIKQP